MSVLIIKRGIVQDTWAGVRARGELLLYIMLVCHRHHRHTSLSLLYAAVVDCGHRYILLRVRDVVRTMPTTIT